MLKANPEQTTEPLAQAVSQHATPRPFAVPMNTPNADKDVDMDAEAEVALIKARMGRG